MSSPLDATVQVNWLELSAMAFLAQYGAVVLDDADAMAILQGVLAKLDQQKPAGAESLDFKDFLAAHLKAMTQKECVHAGDSTGEAGQAEEAEQGEFEAPMGFFGGADC
jgi:hypothetical protein